MARGTQVTIYDQRPWERWYDSFLSVLRHTRNITKACEAAGVARKTAYHHRKVNETFAEAWEEANSQRVEDLVNEAWRRGVDGWVESIEYHDNGQPKKVVRKYSDALLGRLLRAEDPRRFGDEVKGQDELPTDFGSLARLVAEEDEDALEALTKPSAKPLPEGEE